MNSVEEKFKAKRTFTVKNIFEDATILILKEALNLNENQDFEIVSLDENTSKLKLFLSQDLNIELTILQL